MADRLRQRTLPACRRGHLAFIHDGFWDDIGDDVCWALPCRLSWMVIYALVDVFIRGPMCQLAVWYKDEEREMADGRRERERGR